MRLGRWQMQARLMKAFELFDQGHSITYVALELGYSRRGRLGADVLHTTRW